MTDEPTVKSLLEDKAALENVVDEETRRQLARWFELPSFTELEEQRKALVPRDVAMDEAIARRDKALAAVDPATLAAIERRNAASASMLDEPREVLSLSAERDTALVDLDLIDRGYQVGEPREFSLSPSLDDNLRECAPQALLRDLHRPVTTFYKAFEISDDIAATRVDASREAHAAMTTSWKIELEVRNTFAEGCESWDEARAERRMSWQRVYALNLANRRVRE
jgi:hypothetical protein